MRGPTAAPNRWPYREHRTVAEVDRLADGFLGLAHDIAAKAQRSPAGMAAASEQFLAAIERERRA